MNFITNEDKIPYIKVGAKPEYLWISRKNGIITTEPMNLDAKTIIDILHSYENDNEGRVHILNNGLATLRMGNHNIAGYDGVTSKNFLQSVYDSIDLINTTGIPFTFDYNGLYEGFVYKRDNEWKVVITPLSERKDIDLNKGFSIDGVLQTFHEDGDEVDAYVMRLKYDGGVIFSKDLEIVCDSQYPILVPQKLMMQIEVIEAFCSLNDDEVPIVINTTILDDKLRLAKAHIDGSFEVITELDDSHLEILENSKDYIEIQLDTDVNGDKYTLDAINIIQNTMQFGEHYEGADARQLIEDHLQDMAIDFMNSSIHFDPSGKSIYGTHAEKELTERLKLIREVESVKEVESDR